MSVQVLLNGVAAVMVQTLMILNGFRLDMSRDPRNSGSIACIRGCRICIINSSIEPITPKQAAELHGQSKLPQQGYSEAHGYEAGGLGLRLGDCSACLCRGMA